jgi:hypothetical protein
MGTSEEEQKFGSQLQTKLPTRSEAGFFRGMLWCGGSFLTALAALAIQQVYVARTFAAHLEAGGIDDPDAVFGHPTPLIFLAPLAIVICFSGLIVCTIGWLFRMGQRQSRTRNH